MPQTTGSLWKMYWLEGKFSADTEFTVLWKGITWVLKNRWHLQQREIILPQITAVHCIVVLVVLSHQWIFCKVLFCCCWFFLTHFHKAVLRRTLCAGSWMYFEKETPLQRTLSLNGKDGWSKNEGWLFCFLEMGTEAGESDCCGQSHPGSPWNCILIFEVQFQHLYHILSFCSLILCSLRTNTYPTHSFLCPAHVAHCFCLHPSLQLFSFTLHPSLLTVSPSISAG